MNRLKAISFSKKSFAHTAHPRFLAPGYDSLPYLHQTLSLKQKILAPNGICNSISDDTVFDTLSF